MKILEVTCFDLKNDGSLLIKSEMDEANPEYRYCFYIYKGSETLYKSPYDRKSFILYKAEQYGKHKIKAFVRNKDGSEKDECVIDYVVNKANARNLMSNEEQESSDISVKVDFEKIRDCIYLITATGELPESAKYAWYIYNADNNQELFRGPYSASPNFTYDFLTPGNYFAKLFVKDGNRKNTMKSETIAVGVV